MSSQGSNFSLWNENDHSEPRSDLGSQNKVQSTVEHAFLILQEGSALAQKAQLHLSNCVQYIIHYWGTLSGKWKTLYCNNVVD